MDKKHIIGGIMGGLVAVIVAGLIIGGVVMLTKDNSLGSVQLGQDYLSTSTGGNLIPAPLTLLVNGVGALGSVVITGADTGILNFYDATTTDINLRASSKSTSSIWVASIPASTAAGTYIFDTLVTDGLYLERIGESPTSTITFRQY